MVGAKLDLGSVRHEAKLVETPIGLCGVLINQKEHIKACKIGFPPREMLEGETEVYRSQRTQ